MSEHSETDPGVLHPHILPLRIYFGVWGALLVLTGVTVAVSYFDFGAGNMLVAMVVALIKASLVAAFFMHLRYDNKLNAVVFTASLVFMFIFFFLTFADINTRGWVDKYQGTFLNAHKEKPEAKEARPNANNVGVKAMRDAEKGEDVKSPDNAAAAKAAAANPVEQKKQDGKSAESRPANPEAERAKPIGGQPAAEKPAPAKR